MVARGWSLPVGESTGSHRLISQDVTLSPDWPTKRGLSHGIKGDFSATFLFFSPSSHLSVVIHYHHHYFHYLVHPLPNFFHFTLACLH